MAFVARVATIGVMLTLATSNPFTIPMPRAMTIHSCR
jgi:hypothetical protein